MALLAVDAHSVSIPLAMLIVFGAAKLLGEVMERLRQPAIVGEILAGAIVGPSVLGWIQPNEVLTALSELGVMFLLFRVGLEVKSSELMQVGGTAFMVALLGVVAPMGLGWVIMRAWGYPQIESVFVGAAMVATSVGITAQVLAAKGLLHLRTAKIILGAAVIDDILGLIVLAIVSSSAQGTVQLLDIAVTAIMALGFTAIVAKWGTRTMMRLVPHAESNLKVGEAQFNIALVMLFALSVLAIYVGVAAIIGAFLAGMALAESVSHRVHDLAHGITELLVPFFLAGIGLHFDVSAFADRSLLLLGILIVIAAVLSKLIGCGLGATGMGTKDMLRIGLGMVPRGEVGMVVAQLGLSMAVIEKPVYSVVVFMAVATTVVAPPLLNFAYKDVPARHAKEQFQIG
ncbi:MAG TPA: cation:proton antiporter [Bryobacteraceae bacterium]|nr:cation:proton antiporter [Bryobacteraceae bacterium]